MPKKIEVSEEMWDKLRLEYISSDVSLRGLEKKYGVPFSQIQKKAKSGKWAEVKEECKSNTIRKSVDLISTHQAEECTRAFTLANKVLDKLEEVVEKIDPEEEYAVKKLKDVTGAIKNLKEIGLFRSSLDQAEQEARINKLRKDTEDDSDTEITVVFESDLERYLK